MLNRNSFPQGEQRDPLRDRLATIGLVALLLLSAIGGALLMLILTS